MKKIFTLLLVSFVLIFVVGCSTQDSSIIESSTPEDTSSIDGAVITEGSSPTVGPLVAEEGEVMTGEIEIGGELVTTYDVKDSTSFGFTTSGLSVYTGEGLISSSIQQAGQLSASVWDDINNYEFYLSLFEEDQNQVEGIFMSFQELEIFDTLNMVTVSVQNNYQDSKGVIVDLLANNLEVISSSVTNANGQAYLFPKTEQLDSIANIVIRYGSETVVQAYNYSKTNNSISMELVSNVVEEDIIEIMFVIDTTGSMSDEMAYLKAEIDYVLSEVSTTNPNSEIRLALLFYRDQSDEYLTKYYDFTTDIEQQKANLSNQNAAGGGDFEEAVEIALDQAVSKNWSEGNTTKIVFHVLDAPPHDSQEILDVYTTAINEASKKGIRIIPIASSGINKYTEYLLRNEAMITGGTYVFLTGHSGIGGDHIDATVEETEVEYLNDLMIRLINEYHTGVVGVIIPFTTGDQE